MVDPLPCPSCTFANPPGAESCVQCGATLAETPERVHPGETLRDPDDLTLPPSPLLRAVLGGAPDAATAIPSPPPRPSRPAVTRASAEQLSPTADQTAVLRDLAERLHTRKPVEPAAVPYAGFFVRAVAFVVDGAVLAIFGVPLTAAGYFGIRAGLMVVGKTTPIEVDEAFLEFLIAAWFVMATVYFTVLHRSHGQTIGKSLLGLHVRSLHLGPIGFGRSLLRTLAYAASSSFFGLGFVLVALTPRKRGWHDFLAGTCVVRGLVEEHEASA
jgi:uncharacterized RDD family membrane protein YckC